MLAGRQGSWKPSVSFYFIISSGFSENQWSFLFSARTLFFVTLALHYFEMGYFINIHDIVQLSYTYQKNKMFPVPKWF